MFYIQIGKGEEMSLSVGYCLYKLIVSPLEIMFSITFSVALTMAESVWGAILVLSIIVNLITLPLYSMADRKQKEQKAADISLAPWIKLTKKAFRGEERIMRQQALFKEFGRGPFSALKGVFPLLLSIPFFMAAYNFLYKLPLLEGAHMGIISDLGQPDGLLSIASFSINILPILMTIINIVSAMIYTRHDDKKAKVQMILIAVVFLVLLYRSPSGLVFYWTLNNIFSLLKNVFYLVIEKGGLTIKKKQERKKRLLSCLEINEKKMTIIFVLMMLFISLFVGLLLPSNLIASSPEEFIDVRNLYDPSLYVYTSLMISLGTFVLWGGLIFYLFSECRIYIFLTLCFYLVIALSSYFIYGDDAGIISSTLIYDDSSFMLMPENNTCIFVYLAMILMFIVIVNRGKEKNVSVRVRNIIGKVAIVLLLTGCIANMIIGMKNMLKIDKAWEDCNVGIQNGTVVSDEVFEKVVLSPDKENVMVIMLDRMIGAYIPYMMEEKPETFAAYDGFTYYPNVISFGTLTILGSPAIFGGYEYTPENMNKRDDELMKDKHNEALLMMPLMFLREGYEVYSYDMPFSNYSHVNDLTEFKEYPEIHAGYISSENTERPMVSVISVGERHADTFFTWALVQIIPGVAQWLFYDDGSYLLTQRRYPYDGKAADNYLHEYGELPQMCGFSSSRGERDYNKLVNFKNMIAVASDNEAPAAYVAVDNELPHNYLEVQMPEYIPTEIIDNHEYEAERQQGFVLPDGSRMELQDPQVYQSGMAAFVVIGEMLEKMKALGVYDNTRIIIVSDHGFNNGDFPELMYETYFDTEHAYPLLMVKDVYAEGFRYDEKFMTNADVPVLAMDGIVKDMSNPFTGEKISMEEKYRGPQLVLDNIDWEPAEGTTMHSSGAWYSVEGDRRDISNWEFLGVW